MDRESQLKRQGNNSNSLFDIDRGLLSSLSLFFFLSPSGAAARRGLGVDPVVKDTDGN